MASTTIEFSANYRRYTAEASSNLMRISEALGTIRGARVLPAVSDQLRASARVGTIHYSNLIEGNQLPVVEAERAARGQLPSDSRAKIELVNYVDALDLIDRRVDDGTLDLTPDFLKELHGTTTRGIGRDDDPPPDEVEPRISGMFDWLNRKLESGDPAYVVAGVAHYGVTDIHPFADGNGRVARLFQAAILMRAGVLPGRMFSFERYYADDRSAYYAALRSVRLHTLNMERWLEYFLHGLANEYERVATTVADLGSLMPGGGRRPLRLTAGQERALTALRIQGRREFTRREYEQVAGVGRTAAGDDLRELVGHGVLSMRGAAASTRYVFQGAVANTDGKPRRGRPVKWTDAAIERELRVFVAGRTEWPTHGEFSSAGRGALYAAAVKAGGIARWRSILGL